ncbi:MAG: DNA mismatch endonuclease Vsr [Desulfovibrio sp.]|nr:DNA mismatch endonuclease Vsr [Desulfovibrio sp.]
MACYGGGVAVQKRDKVKSPLSRSEIMGRIRSKDTKPELLVRRTLHRLGFRYRLHVKDLPGKPDLVFPSRRTVLFVQGCFWHGHDCKVGNRAPKTNQDYWREKIARNRNRDVISAMRLVEAGWKVLVVWECELISLDNTIARVVATLNAHDSQGAS